MSQFSGRHIGVLVGRFQPFHKGHEYLVDTAFAAGIRHFVLVLGSSGASPCTRNPFNDLERTRMLRAWAEEFWQAKGYDPDEDASDADTRVFRRGSQAVSLQFRRLPDSLYSDDLWAGEFFGQLFLANDQPNISPAVAALCRNPRFVLLGCNKDETSWYLSMFPELDTFFPDRPLAEREKVICSTDIRERFFLGWPDYGQDLLPCSVHAFLEEYREEPGPPEDVFPETPGGYAHFHEEFGQLRAYKDSWRCAPYPVVFVTVDAVVVQDNHILLIRRKSPPGKGLWALPGGFLQEKETLVRSMIRELREETGLRLPAKVLERNIRYSRVFDHPLRSNRGRTITHCFLIRLESMDARLPEVKGSSDADKARWVHYRALRGMRSLLFEDHWDIIQAMLGGPA